ncbi:MAG: hypothetical protein MI784_14650, partial [Cytophagales bacterium]|nr:hypothetical protein [Cytophagales bacterium]
SRCFFLWDKHFILVADIDDSAAKTWIISIRGDPLRTIKSVEKETPQISPFFWRSWGVFLLTTWLSVRSVLFSQTEESETATIHICQIK